MNFLTSKRSWLLAPVISLLFALLVTIVCVALESQTLKITFDNDGHSPVELMTLPLFALIIPLVWLCPPQAGSIARQARWSALWTILGGMAIVRETDLHKLLFANLWPEIDNSFTGTVFKMRFLKDGGIPLMPKLFVILFFIAFFVAALIPLVRYGLPLVKGFFRFEPVAWTMAVFGGVSVVVLTLDRLPSNLLRSGIRVSRPLLACIKAFEEGGEMLMALLALLAVLQAHLWFNRRLPGDNEG